MSSNPPSPTDPMPECIADRYDVKALLGRGGMAAAYRVSDRVTGDEVALKYLTVRGAAAEAVELFEREFHTLNQLAHPRVVRAFDYGLDETQPYYTMELLDGGDVRALSPMPWQDVCVMAYEVCSALSLLHSRRLVHRDITPRNIRRTADGKAKLIDFGLLSPFGPCGLLAGTPPYVAPELANHMSLDGRSDLFSLGGTLYYALTGRVAFPARRFDQLRDVWRGAPISPAKLKPEIPEALDKLVMALLRIDVGSRPKSAAEVMDRLAPLLEVPPSEELTVASAYLSAPQLIGRDSLTTRVRKQMVRSMRGRGGGFLVSGASGTGRSRVLDAFVLEAKLMGATPARAGASDAARGAFGVARTLAEQLHDSAPMASLAAARRDPAVFRVLFGDAEPGQASGLADIARPGLARGEVQKALRDWIYQLASARFIAIAVDDWELIDEPSAALLATLSLDAERYRFAYAVSGLEDGAADAGRVGREGAGQQGVAHALSLLRERANDVVLEPLSQEETSALLGSVFGEVPHIDGVARQLHALTGGKPRAVMAFAQHLVDERVITYAGGVWKLPQRVDPEQMPAAMEDALVAQLTGLSPAATYLGRLLSLSVLQRLSRAQMVGLGEWSVAEVDAGVDELLRNQLLAGGPAGYQLSHARSKRLLADGIEPALRARLHDQLAALYERGAEPIVVVCHHRLQGGDEVAALDELLSVSRTEERRVALAYGGFETIGGDLTGRTIQMALEVAKRHGRGPQDLYPLWITLAGIAAVGEDARFYYDLPDDWLALLKRDSGFLDWQGLSDLGDPATRAVQAFVLATQRYEATPEAERVLTPSDAIQGITSYVVFSIAISSRTGNAALARTLPPLLEPFAPLNPLVEAMYRNATGTRAHTLGQRERSRGIFIEVVRTLDGMENVDSALVDRIRAALCLAIANLSVGLGLQPDEAWLHTQDPAQHVAIELIKKVAALHRGDWEAAESHRRQAELIALQNRTGTMFSVLNEELEAHAFARELTGLKSVREQIRMMAAQHPGWVAATHLADAFYFRLCEEPDRAMTAVEAALGLPDTGDMEDRASALARAIQVELMVEQGRLQEARELGIAAAERARDHARHHIARHVELAVSLAEAKLGDYGAARQRIQAVQDELIALGVTGLFLGRTYEYLGRIALWNGQERDFMGAARELIDHYQPGRSSVLGALYERLMEEARQVGTLDWRGVLGSESENDSDDEIATQVENTLVACEDHRQRAKAALELLCGDGEQAGYLFLLTPEGLQLCAATEAPGDVELLSGFAQAHLELELDDDVCTMTAGLGQGVGDDSSVPSSIELNERGRYYPLPLIGHDDGELCVVGIALLREHRTQQEFLATMAEHVAMHLIRSGEYRPLAAA